MLPEFCSSLPASLLLSRSASRLRRGCGCRRRCCLPPSALQSADCPLALHLLGFTDPNRRLSSSLFADLPITSVTFIYVFLPLLVFEAGFATDVRRTLDDAAPILLLAVIATVIATAVIGLSLWPLAGRPARGMPACSAPSWRPLTRRPSSQSFATSARRRGLRGWLRARRCSMTPRRFRCSWFCSGMILSGRQADIAGGFTEFVLSFVGGGIFGICVGRLLVSVMSAGRRRSARGSVFNGGLRLLGVHCCGEAPTRLWRRYRARLRPNGECVWTRAHCTI